MPMDKHLSLLVQDTDVHGAGMQGDTAVKWVLFGVASQQVSSSSWCFSYYQHTTAVC